MTSEYFSDQKEKNKDIFRNQQFAYNFPQKASINKIISIKKLRLM